VNPNAWVAITAIATCVLVIGTLVAVHWQVQAQREANAVAVLLHLIETWDGEHMRKNRENLKVHLQSKSPVGAIKVGKLMTPVANYFELVGFLTRRRVLDEEMVWSAFSYYAVLYFAALKPRIDDERKHDPTLYTDFEWLHEKIQRRMKEAPTPQDIRDFVDNEPNN
jgi:hypothetical protein